MSFTGISEALIFILLLSFVLTGQTYSSNSTFEWPGEIIKSNSLDDSTGHYHHMTDNGFGKINVRTSANYNNHHDLRAKTLWINTKSYELSSNSCYEFLLILSFSMRYQSWITYYSHVFVSIFVNYYDQQSLKQILIVKSISWKSPQQYQISLKTLNESVIQFGIRNQNEFEKWLFPDSNKVLKRENSFIEFDVVELIKAVQSKFNKSQNFTITNIIPRIQTNNIIADIDLNVSKTLSQTKCCQLSTISLSNFSVSSQVLQNVTKPNYCKIFFNGSTLGQVAFGFNFQNLPYGLKSYQFVAFGYLSTKWVTPTGAYQLPLQSSTNAEINVDFAFGYAQSVTPSHTAVCFTVVLRNDYNPNNESFSSTKANPSAEIRVCPWWRAAMPDSKRIKVVRLSGEQFYGMHVSAADWPIFTFISIFPVEQTVRKFKLFDFVEEVRKYNPTYNTHHISCIQMGFRVYSGMGAFTIEQLALNIAIIPDSALKAKSTQCLMQNLGKVNNLEKQCGTGSIVYAVINQIMTTPNIGLLLRMVCIFQFIDDLTYYAYHKNNYDDQFRGLALIAWNLTASKWIIPQLEPIYQHFDFSYNPNLSPDPANFIPETYAELGEDANFLRQTEDYWISSLPMTILTFVIYHFLFMLLRHFQMTKRFSEFFKRFHFFSFLVVVAIGDNLQYMSFRCFSQIYQLFPLGRSQLIAISVAYISLFFVILYAASAYFVLPSFLARERGQLTEGFKFHFKTIVYLTGVSLLKVCTGMAHSLLYDTNYLQIVTLLLIQILLFCLFIYVRPFYEHKSLFYCHFAESGARVAMHVVLAIETFAKYLKMGDLFLYQKVNIIIIKGIVSFSLLDIILSNIVGTQVFQTIVNYFKCKNRKQLKVQPKSVNFRDSPGLNKPERTEWNKWQQTAQSKKHMFKTRHKKIKQAMKIKGFHFQINIVQVKPTFQASLNQIKA